MKYKAAAGTLVAGSIAVLLAACGGGGGGGALAISGTAAVGAALPGAIVDVRCMQGSGTTTTGADGTYAIAIAGGVAPCILQATTTTTGGVPIVLHSALPAGLPNPILTVNLTPLTELTMAHAVPFPPNLPLTIEDLWNALHQGLTLEHLEDSQQYVARAIEAAGLPSNGISFLWDRLHAAYQSVVGDGHDQLLDQFGLQVPPGALPSLVNQVAAAAAAGGGGGNVITAAVAGGVLPGCPTALSGQYRTLDLWGKTVARDVDFKNMRMRAANGTDWLALTADAGAPCSFVATGTEDGRPTETAVVIGPQGAGAYRTRYTDGGSPGIDGYIFPVQAHGVAEIEGRWSYLNSGRFGEWLHDHLAGEWSIDAAGTVTGCRYDTDTWTCNPSSGPAVQASARADGGFDVPPLGPSVPVVHMYAYRAPSGSLTLFGSQMTGDYNDDHAVLTSIVAARLDRLPLPAAGSASKYWEIQFVSNDGIQTSTAPRADAVTVDSVDASASVVRRHRASDNRADTLQYNQPLTGMRSRQRGADNGVDEGAAIQIPLPGLGMTVSANAVPADDTGVMFHVLGVQRP